jgi:hypothetical protein
MPPVSLLRSPSATITRPRPARGACPGANTRIAARDTATIRRYFPVSRFPAMHGEFEPGKIDNAFSTFSAGGRQWMALTLELWARTAAVDWAKTVVASHPDYNVIVATHSYLDADGSIYPINGGYGANSPQYLYDNLIRRYPTFGWCSPGIPASPAAGWTPVAAAIPSLRSSAPSTAPRRTRSRSSTSTSRPIR